jgi:outer membrane protein assembly factor BamE (lipoprotein component of BamABCDE complex)
MKQIYRLACLFIVCVLAGCASPGAILPNTTTTELVQKLGTPTDKRTDPRGGEFWDYVYGPEGYTTWRFAVDKGGIVRSSEQLLTLERLYKVVPGETNEAGVLELLGRPRMIVRYSHEVVWEWRVNLSPVKGVYLVRFGFDGRAHGVGVLEDMPLDGDKL